MRAMMAVVVGHAAIKWRVWRRLENRYRTIRRSAPAIRHAVLRSKRPPGSFGAKNLRQPEQGLQMRDSLALHAGRYHFFTVAPSLPPALGLGHSHPGILRLPGIERALRHPVLAAQIGTLRPRLMLLQDADDLLFGSICSLHYPTLPWGGL